jgi:hypothetical protein
VCRGHAPDCAIGRRGTESGRRPNFEIFLRFTHRYWFREIADQAQAKAKALIHLFTGQLGRRTADSPRA